MSTNNGIISDIYGVVISPESFTLLPENDGVVSATTGIVILNTPDITALDITGIEHINTMFGTQVIIINNSENIVNCVPNIGSAINRILPAGTLPYTIEPYASVTLIYIVSDDRTGWWII